MPLKDHLQAIGRDLKTLGKNAVSEIGNTYQAVLMQDTGWTNQGILPDLTQETAEQIARTEVEIENQPEMDLGNDIMHW
jgi:hypothetical protein